jgi:hypothetical protein
VLRVFADDVWNESAFDALMGTSEVFLNLHKLCRKRHPVTFRNAVLLNAQKLIVSERAHCRDEAEYEGMIHFADFDALPALYERLVASDWRSAQRLAHERFATRFAPEALFRRAAIYRDWGLGPHDGADVGAAAMYDPRYRGGAAFSRGNPASTMPVNTGACSDDDMGRK